MSIRLVADTRSSLGKHFVIEEDEAVGYYLYVYQSENCIADFLEETLDAAVEKACQEYSVPKESWKEA